MKRGSVLGESISIQGTMRGNEDLTIEGDFAGEIHLGEATVVVGREARVDADVEAGRAIIMGRVNGSVTAKHLVQLTKTGTISGEIRTPRLDIEDGAMYQGSVYVKEEF